MGNICSSNPIKLTPSNNNWKKTVFNEEDLCFTPGLFIKENFGNFYSSYSVQESLLGCGRYGEIFKCTHIRTNTIRVVKIISKSKLDQDEIESRAVFKEVEILKNLDHPSLPILYEFFEDKDNFYIVLELCEGGDLFDRIVDQGYFPESQASIIMYKIFSGLAYLHCKKIIHRDIKPENILFKDKEKLKIKIIDFDAATLFNKENKGIHGTPLYMAPEIIKKTHTEKCDMWSCGIILYELFLGRPPYDGSDEEIFEILKNPKINIDYDCRSISESGRDLLKKLLEPDPTKRISAHDACMHPWIKQYNKKEVDNNHVSEVLSRMKDYRKTSKLKEAVHTFIISKITNINHSIEDSVFHKIDINEDGIIDKSELMRVFSCEMPEEEAEMYSHLVMENVDSDKNGEIEYTDFLRATINSSKIVTKEHLSHAFCYFDENENGIIELNELSSRLTDGNIISEELVMKIMKQVDKNGDGFIDINEFEDSLVDALYN